MTLAHTVMERCDVLGRLLELLGKK